MNEGELGFDERAAALGAIAYRVGYRILGDRHDAQDVTQEALARAFARWSRIGPYDEAWISRVATNLALGTIRRRGRAERARGITAGAGAGTGDPSGARDLDAVVAQRRELVAGLAKLPKRQREVIALRYLADLSEADVAAALGCSIGTVKQHASRGLAAMRVSLAPDTSPSAAREPDRPRPRPTVGRPPTVGPDTTPEGAH